jgi:D-alanyl-D-alanine dipeptidase
MRPTTSYLCAKIKILNLVIALVPIGLLLDSIGGESNALENSRQCVVVITDSWTAPDGVAHRFEREDRSGWQRRGGPSPVLVGRAGLAWGRGETKTADLAGPIKHEGDDKAPAGVFQIGTAFGYAQTPVTTKMPYLPVSPNVVAVDDPQSRYYNRLVDKTKIRDADWRTAENMILTDNRYKWGIVVMHNVPPTSGAGSCIFLHVWKDRLTATSGCTAMPEESLLNLIGWLDPRKGPLLVQLPRSIYNELQARWALPIM